MRFNCKTIVVGFLSSVSLLSINTSYALTSEETLIQGFSKWQADRIERIVLDEAISDIAEDKYVKRFFSQTSDSVQLYENVSSKRLIPLMQFYIKEDLNLIKGVGGCLKDNVDYLFTESISLDERASRAKLVYSDIKSLASKPKNSSVFSVVDFTNSSCGLDRTALGLIDAKTLGEQEITRIALELAQKISEKPDKGIVPLAGMKKIPDTVIDLLSKEGALLTFVNTINEFNSLTKKDTPYVVKVHQLIQVIEYFGISEEDYSGFIKLKSTGLFFASLADASDSQDPDTVVAVLTEFVDERDVFNRKYNDNAYYSSFDVVSTNDEGKLEKVSYSSICSQYWILPCKDSLFISSYYGLSYSGLKESQGADREWEGRAFGPVGVELKLATSKSRVISLSLSPLDLGNYITNELKEKEYDAKIEDIVAPSAFISISSKSKPLAFLIGYQKDIKISENYKTEGPFVALVFDLPVFTIY